MFRQPKSLVKILTTSEIANPSAPMIRIPTAETFATVLNSRADGFLRICQTLLDWRMKEISFPMVSLEKECF